MFRQLHKLRKSERGFILPIITALVIAVFVVATVPIITNINSDITQDEAFLAIGNTPLREDIDLNGHNLLNAGDIYTSLLDADTINGPVGRGYTLTVAAVDSTDLEKNQADYQCDGTADQVEINAAINALPEQCGSVLLYSGNFTVTDSVCPLHDLFLSGSGVGVTVIRQADNANIATGVFYANGNFNRGVAQYFTIDGNKANNASGNYGMYLRGVWYAKIMHVAIHDCKKDGFRSTTTAGGTYCGEIYHEDVASYDNDEDGFALAGSGDNFLIDCYAYGNAIIGFHCSMTHNAMFHCHPYDNGWYGISLDNTADHCGIFDACLDRNYRAGMFIQGDYNRIEGCYALANSKDGVGLYSGFRVTGTYNTFVGNLAKDPDTPQNQHYGIEEQTTADYNCYIGNILDMNIHDELVIVGAHSENTTNIF